jgi:hypothetical protein
MCHGHPDIAPAAPPAETSQTLSYLVAFKVAATRPKKKDGDSDSEILRDWEVLA